MAVRSARIYNPNGSVIKDFESWSLYAAFTRPANDSALVKIGISTRPMERLYTIHVNSPYPIDVALWVSAGDASMVRKLERAVHAAFAHRSTRGEWFQFNLASAVDRREFHDTLRKLYYEHTGRPLQWKKTNLEQICKFGKKGGGVGLLTHRDERLI